MNVDNLWYDQSFGARTARSIVTPLSWVYGSAIAARNALYDFGVSRVHDSPIPVVSIGNVTVGGTGKTPFSAHVVRVLITAGHRPAVVMRGYGDDERRLHVRMNPGTPVVVGADRVDGIRSAAAAGADVVVLDDGFQHRRAQRDLDIVLVSAEKWSSHLKLLPAGPLREPLSAIRRADLIVVTQKSATDDEVQSVKHSIRGLHDMRAEVATAALEPTGLISVRSGNEESLAAIRGARVLAVAGVGDPDSFFAQLRQLGATVTERRFRDHHPYTAAEAMTLCTESSSHKYVVTTGKDAMKLSPLWPPDCMELWYLSQAVRITDGTSLLAATLAKLF